MELRRPRPDVFSQSSPNCLDGRVYKIGDYQQNGGAHSDIWMGSFADQPVAIKILRTFNLIDKEKLHKVWMFFVRVDGVLITPLQRLWREHRTWSSLNHPNIHQCLGHTYDFTPESANAIPALVSPWMPNGTLREYVAANREADRLSLVSKYYYLFIQNFE